MVELLTFPFTLLMQHEIWGMPLLVWLLIGLVIPFVVKFLKGKK